MPNRKRVSFKSKQKRNILSSLLLYAIPIILITAGSYYLYGKIAENKNFTSISILPDKKSEPQTADLENKINKILAKYPDMTIGVSVVNANGETSNLGVQKSYTGASTTKVLTAVAFLSEVEDGTKSLEKYTGNYTYQWHLQQMINQSNNDSWAVLLRAIGYQNLQDYARSIGIKSYMWDGNTIAPADEAILLSKLDKGELINESHKKLLYSYMQNTNVEDLISPAIPDNLTFYHKYGILDYHLHDIATIKGDGKTVNLVIMTKAKKTIPYEDRALIFQEIAKAVVDHNWPKT